jgi:hypothetical protein
MKLWLLKAREDLDKNDDPWEPWYDKAFGFVVRAENEERAREIAQSNGGDEKRRYRGNWNGYDKLYPWIDPKYSTCVELTTEGQEGMVLMDFHSA